MQIKKRNVVAFRRELRQLNKSLQICDIRLKRVILPIGSYICLTQVVDLFNITLTASQNITQEYFAYHF